MLEKIASEQIILAGPGPSKIQFKEMLPKHLQHKIIDVINFDLDDENKILKELKEKGFTYLIIRFDLFNQWTNTQFDDRKKEMLKIFFSEHVKHILSKDGYGLFELKNIE